jgi:DASH complex subunit DAD3
MASTNPAPTSSSTLSITPPDPSQTLTPLEQEVLDEYAKLLENLNSVRISTFPRIISTPYTALRPKSRLPPAFRGLSFDVDLTNECLQLAPLLASLSTTPTAAVLDGLRLLERKTSLVSTLLKASVYSIVLQQQMMNGDVE